MAKLEIIALAIFGLLAMAGLAVFALYRGSSTEAEADLLIWGTVPHNIINGTIGYFRSQVVKLSMIRLIMFSKMRTHLEWIL